MADEHVLGHINELVDEEHRLRSGGGPVDAARLKHIEEELDQCWDLLRQRRARRDAHQPVSEAHLRSVKTVENYEG